MENNKPKNEGVKDFLKGSAAVAAIGLVGAVVGQDRMVVHDGEKFDDLLHTPAGVYNILRLGNEEDSGVLFQDESGRNHFSVTDIPEDIKKKLVEAYEADTTGLRVWIQDGGVKILKEVE
jgi:hypothetical protein